MAQYARQCDEVPSRVPFQYRWHSKVFSFPVATGDDREFQTDILVVEISKFRTCLLIIQQGVCMIRSDSETRVSDWNSNIVFMYAVLTVVLLGNTGGSRVVYLHFILTYIIICHFILVWHQGTERLFPFLCSWYFFFPLWHLSLKLHGKDLMVAVNILEINEELSDPKASCLNKRSVVKHFTCRHISVKWYYRTIPGPSIFFLSIMLAVWIMCDVSKMYNHGGKMKDVKQCWYYTVCYYQISLQVETKQRINHHQNGVFAFSERFSYSSFLHTKWLESDFPSVFLNFYFERLKALFIVKK